MTLSLVSMENTVSQGSVNSRQEKAEELEKLDNGAAAAGPGQLGKGRSGMAPVSYWWAFWVASLNIPTAGLLPTAGVSSRLQWQGHSLFLSVLTLAKVSPPNHRLGPAWVPTTPAQPDLRTPNPRIPARSPGTAQLPCH